MKKPGFVSFAYIRAFTRKLHRSGASHWLQLLYNFVYSKREFCWRYLRWEKSHPLMETVHYVNEVTEDRAEVLTHSLTLWRYESSLFWDFKSCKYICGTIAIIINIEHWQSFFGFFFYHKFIIRKSTLLENSPHKI